MALAAEHGVAVGAHPGLPDVVGFGRRRMVLSPAEVESIILYQTGALTAFLAKHGLELNHIKPHGALYGMLAGDEELMQAAAGTALQFGVPFYGLAGTAHESVCRAMGVEFVAELYVDLNYGPAGELLIQRRPAPTDPDAAAERVSRALAGNPSSPLTAPSWTSRSKASASTPTHPIPSPWPPQCVRSWAEPIYPTI